MRTKTDIKDKNRIWRTLRKKRFGTILNVLYVQDTKRTRTLRKLRTKTDIKDKNRIWRTLTIKDVLHTQFRCPANLTIYNACSYIYIISKCHVCVCVCVCVTLTVRKRFCIARQATTDIEALMMQSIIKYTKILAALLIS